MHGKVLIASPDPDARIAFSDILRQMGQEVHTIASWADAPGLLSEADSGFTAVILDSPPGNPAKEVMAAASRTATSNPDVPVVVAVERIDLAAAGKASGDSLEIVDRDSFLGNASAFPLEKIMALVKLFDESQRLRSKIRHMSRTLDALGEVFRRKYNPVGRSEQFLNLMDQARKLANIPRPVLITGERGTGKEIVAGAMHFMGPRESGPFVTVNCSAFQGTLLESELFGHEKGAFTGADRRRTGRFEAASGGTLFLDEIGDMAPDFQAKVLRVIEYQEFERIGGNEKIKVDVRVVAATNADLKKRMKEGGFREDLYDRITFAVIEVPPLRERPDDIEELVERFSKGIASEVPGVVPRRFSKAVLDRFRDYPWPGNVRELKNVVERLTCLGRSAEVRLAELPPEMLSGPAPSRTFEELVEDFQVTLIMDALHKCGSSQKKAAAALGLTYDQFRHLVRKFGVMDMLKDDA